MSQNNDGVIYQLAFYEIRAEALPRVKAAIEKFVAYIRANEPGTLRYDVWQVPDHPTRFVHIFIFRNQAAHDLHSASTQVRQFADVLYPECLAPVQFIGYQQVASKNSL
jgi:quinol monooxygenase YgiN